MVMLSSAATSDTSQLRLDKITGGNFVFIRSCIKLDRPDTPLVVDVRLDTSHLLLL